MRLAYLGWIASVTLGCDHLVAIDVDCQKLCLTSPGPTLPGVPNQPLMALDAASVPAITADWVAEMPFDEVLSQLPSAAAGLSANVRLSSVNLNSITDLSSIAAVDIFWGHGATRAATGRSMDVGANTGEDVVMDAGADAAALRCRTAESSLRVAYFRASEADPSKTSLAMVIVNPDLNLFDCMKDSPTIFDVRMTLAPDVYPAADAPLTLATCVGAQTHVDYP